MQGQLAVHAPLTFDYASADLKDGLQARGQRVRETFEPVDKTVYKLLS